MSSTTGSVTVAGHVGIVLPVRLCANRSIAWSYLKGYQSVSRLEQYALSVQARAAGALVRSPDEPFGPLSAGDHTILQRYANDVSELADKTGDLAPIQRLHLELVMQLTVDGARQLNVASYAFALNDCREQDNQLACAYVEEKNKQVEAAGDGGGTESSSPAGSNSSVSTRANSSRPRYVSTVPDNLLIHLGAGAEYLRENVRGMKQSDKDLLAQLVETSERLRGSISDDASESLWVSSAGAFTRLSAGARMLLNEGMKRDTGITAEEMFHTKLQEYGRIVPVGRSSGCPSAGVLLVMPLLLVFVLVTTIVPALL